MKEKVLSLSGDDFTITLTDGTPVCKCKGKVFSLHGTKSFTDLQGNELFTVKKKMLSIQKSFVCESPQGYSFEVKGHFSIGTSKSSVHFKNAADGQQIELDLKGDWFDRSATISLGGRPVAEVARKFFNMREMFGDKQTVSVFSCLSRKRPNFVLMPAYSTSSRSHPTSTLHLSQPSVSAWTSERTRSKVPTWRTEDRHDLMKPLVLSSTFLPIINVRLDFPGDSRLLMCSVIPALAMLNAIFNLTR